MATYSGVHRSWISVNLDIRSSSILSWKLKKDIVRTNIPGDICMSAQCPHNISLVRHISFVRCYADIVRTLCRHISPGIYVRTISFFGFHLWIHEGNIQPCEKSLCGHYADIYLQGYMSLLYPSSVFSSGWAENQERITKDGIAKG